MAIFIYTLNAYLNILWGAFKDGENHFSETFKALRLLSELEIFQRGGVLIGTAALYVYRNMVDKVYFPNDLFQTTDLDILLPNQNGNGSVSYSIIEARQANQGEYVDNVRPRLQGIGDIRIEFLASLLGADELSNVRFDQQSSRASHFGFVRMSNGLGITAFLVHSDFHFLAERTIDGQLIYNGDVISVRVPHPLYFVLNKFYVSAIRDSDPQGEKDLRHATSVLKAFSFADMKNLKEAWSAVERLGFGGQLTQVLRASREGREIIKAVDGLEL